MLVVFQLRRLLSVPLVQRAGAPRESPVEMAEVAGVRPTHFHGLAYRRAADRMAPDGAHQAVGRVRHVAVVAAAAGGLRCMVGMRGNVGRDRLMALSARGVPVHAGRHLVRVRPFGQGPRILGRLMHRVAGETAQRPLRRVGVDIAG